MTEQTHSEHSYSRQVVVFVRVNNMDTMEVEKQETFVVDSAAVDPDVAIYAGLTQAQKRWESALREGRCSS